MKENDLTPNDHQFDVDVTLGQILPSDVDRPRDNDSQNCSAL